MPKSKTNAKPTLVIFGRNLESRKKIAEDLAVLRPDLSGFEIETMDMAAIGAFNPDVHCVVLDLQTFSPMDEVALSNLLGSGYKGPVIVLSSRISESSSASYSSENLIFFDLSRGSKELLGIVKRAVTDSIIAGRRHQRHSTNEVADVQIEGRKDASRCKVLNLSQGGALLQAEKALPIAIGMKLTVKFHLKAVQKIRTIQARVAWVKESTFGVQFVGQENL